MAKPFKILREAMPDQARRRASSKARAMLQDMALAELRQARRLSQEELAATLQIRQAGVSRMEKRTDMYLSTLRRFIEAMGGKLDVVARFPEGEVRINQFENLDEGD
jgi:transcriptional regulator with XRE-family HTH domain